MTLYPDMKPNSTADGYNVYIRPSLDILLNELFFKRKNQYEMGIWSCQDQENTEIQIRHFLKSMRYK